MTTVQDTLTYADGRKINGQLVISWPVFQFEGVAVAAGMQTYEVVDGVLDMSLYSNLNAQPLGVYYTVVYELDAGARYEEYWIIPNLPTVNVGQIRVNFPTAPSVMINALQLLSAGATPGQFLGWNGSHWVPMYVTTINVTPNTIGLNLGTAGNDLAVIGSPAQLGNSLTLNVPDASPTARGVVTTGAQQFAGNKAFQGSVVFLNGITVSGSSTISGYVPTTRQINTGYGLQGGGALTGNLNLSVVDNTSVQKIQVFANTVLEGTHWGINFIAGPNMTITVTDNQGSDWVDVMFESVGGGGGGQTLPIGSATGDMMNWVKSTSAPPGFWTVLPVGAAGTVLSSTATGVTWIPGVHQSPWLTDIDANSKHLNNLAGVGVGTAATAGFPVYVYSTGGIQYPVMVLTAGVNNFGVVHEETSATGFAGFLAMNDLQTTASLIVGGSNHTNTAWRNNAVLVTNSNLVFCTGGGNSPERMRLSAAGNLGIGTPAPGSILHVFVASGNCQVTIQTPNAAPFIDFIRGSQQWYLGCGIAADNNFQIYDAVNARYLFTATTAGLVGVGTSTPLNNFHTKIGGNQNIGLRSQYGMASIGSFNDAGTLPAPLDFDASLFYFSTGNVGIAAPAPSTLFQVRPTPVDSGSLTMRGAAFIKSATFNGGSALAAPEPALILGREGLSGQAYANFAEFQLSRYENVGVGSRTQLTIALAHDTPTNNNPWVLSMYSSGRVAVAAGVNSAGGMYVNSNDMTNQVNGAPWYGLGYATNLNMTQVAGYFGINFQTGGGAMVMTSAGNVGIRTTTPVSALQVVGSSGLTSFTGTRRFGLSVSGSASNNDYSGIDFVRGTEVPYASIGVMFSDSGSYLNFGTSNNYGAGITSAAMIIDPNGNVGIGAVPTARFDVQFARSYMRGAGEPYVLGLFGYPSWPVVWLGADSSGNFILSNYNGGELFRIQATTGNVGFGLANPQYRLDVTGSVNVTGNFYVNGVAVGSGQTQNKTNIYQNSTFTGTWGALNFKNGVLNQVGMLGSSTVPGGIDIWYDFQQISDQRIKKNVVALDGGVAIINQLRPIAAEYNGLAGYTDGQRVVSVMAQDLVSVLPGAVRSVATKLRADDAATTDLLAIDPLEVLWHTVLAVQELDARLKKVEPPV